MSLIRRQGRNSTRAMIASRTCDVFRPCTSLLVRCMVRFGLGRLDPRFLSIRQRVGCSKKVGDCDSFFHRTGKPPENSLEVHLGRSDWCGFASSREWSHSLVRIHCICGDARVTVQRSGIDRARCGSDDCVGRPRYGRQGGFNEDHHRLQCCVNSGLRTGSVPLRRHRDNDGDGLE